MIRSKRITIVAELTVLLKRRGSWCGETHIQKAAYVSQELVRVHTGFEFVLYKHGPFSFDLRDTLGQMRSEGVLELEYRPYPYGPSLNVPKQQLENLERRSPLTLRRFRKRLEFVADQLAPYKVSQLEQLATALYVLRELPHASRSLRCNRLRLLKPHVSLEHASWAVGRIDELATSALSLVPSSEA